MDEREDETERVVKEIIKSAIQTGVEYILNTNPLLNEEYLKSQINGEVIYDTAGGIIQSEEFAKLGDGQTQSQYLHQGLLRLFEQGEAFKGPVRNIVSRRKDLEERASSGFFRGSVRKELKDENKRYSTYLTARGIIDSLTPEDAQRMPELAEASSNVLNAGASFLPVEIAGYYGLIDEETYKQAKGEIEETIDTGREKIAENVVKYTKGAAQKAVAVILGGIGLVILLASGLKVTGNVVSNISNTSIGLFGGLLLFISLALFLIRNNS